MSLCDRFSASDVDACHLASDIAYPADQAHTLRHADRSPRIEDVEKVRALETQFVYFAQREAPLRLILTEQPERVENAEGFSFVKFENPAADCRVGRLEVIDRKLQFFILPQFTVNSVAL